MADTQKRKKIVNIVRKKTIFPKDKLSTMITKMMTYIRPNWSTTIEKKANTNTKTKQESHIGPKNAKTAQYKNIAVKTQRVFISVCMFIHLFINFLQQMWPHWFLL